MKPIKAYILKTEHILLDLLEYNALLILNSFHPGNMMLALLEPSIKFVVPKKNSNPLLGTHFDTLRG